MQAFGIVCWNASYLLVLGMILLREAFRLDCAV